MYKEHRKKVLQASMSVEAAEDCQRLEHYRELQSQALDLRRRLSEVLLHNLLLKIVSQYYVRAKFRNFTKELAKHTLKETNFSFK